MLADMPFITSQMLLEMQRVFLEHQPMIVASRFGEVIAPPHIFSSDLLPVLGQTGAKPLIKQHPEQTIFMDWAEEKLFDVDTPEDFLEFETRLSKLL
jgi:molybdenum cofactor cytidylyltransferase